jgi:hypothetical protein
MDRELFIKLLDDQKDALKEFITASNTVTHAKFINEIEKVDKKVDILDAKADTIVAHNKWQNNKLGKHDDAIRELEKADWGFEAYQKHCPANKLATRISKPRFWVIASFVVIGIYLVLATLYHTIGFAELIQGLLRLA